MDVKAGMSVGFTTALGGLFGLGAGYALNEVFDLRNARAITAASAALGGLTGAFIAGSAVATSATTAATPAPVLPAPAQTTSTPK